MESNLKKDYLKCQEIIKEHSRTFYKAFSKIKDVNQRQAIYGVYAYCRYADDIMDEAKDIKALNELRSELDLFVETNEANNYIFNVLKDIRSKFYHESFDFKPYYDMLEGQLMDYHHKGYQTLDELILYCQKVASSVGYMLIDILAPNVEDQRLGSVANDLGIAMQITNILRDIGEDYRNGRVYLPVALMHQYGLTKGHIDRKEINTHLIDLINALEKVALDYYNKAEKNLDVFPRDTRLPLAGALYLYRDILNAIHESDYDVLTKKNYVSEERKVKLIKEVVEKYGS